MKTTRAAGPSWPPLITTDEAEDPRLPGGILTGIGSVAVVAACLVAAVLPQPDSLVRYGVVVATIFGFAALCRSWGATLAVGAIGFLVFDGFLVNQAGELSWHGGADAARLGALGAAVICGRILGVIYQPRGPHRSGPGPRSVQPGPSRPPAEPVWPADRARGPMAFDRFIKEETHDA